MKNEREQLQAHIAELEAENKTLQAQLDYQQGRLTALTQLITALRMTRERATLLQLVTARAMDFVPGADQVLIWLFEPASEYLVLRSVYGHAVPHLRVQPGQGLAGRAYLAPRAMKFVDEDLNLALTECGLSDQRILARLLPDHWPPHSAIAAPLRIEHEALGAMVLLGGQHGKQLLGSDLLFVQTLADLITLALAEARQEAHVADLDQALHQSEDKVAETQEQLDAVQAGLLQSAKLAAVGQLAASVAHEINNPLYAVRTSLYLAAQDLLPDAPQHEFLNLAQQELGRIARIIARMRDFYKPAERDLEPTDLNVLVQETLLLAATHLRHTRIEVVQQLAPELCLVEASADQIRQVIINLVLNAGDAMTEGGVLKVITRSVERWVEVVISDTGCGMPPEVQERIFEPFFTTKSTGTGLGLAVSYHIVAQHGGSLSIESLVGHGTTCTVRLPALVEA